jgi:acetylornithine deacetylase/succinyl-diaminopimelate desuccinylase-like protein
VFYDFSPQYNTDYNSKDIYFSTDRAFEHVKAISKEQHYVGTVAHSRARNYIVNELEKLNLEVQTQQDFCINKYGEYTIPENIITKLEGEDPEAKALLLMSH